jgi:hypothetical protein
VVEQILKRLSSFALLAQPFCEADFLYVLQIWQADPVTDKAVKFEKVFVFIAGKFTAVDTGNQAIYLNTAIVQLTGKLQGEYFASRALAGCL